MGYLFDGTTSNIRAGSAASLNNMEPFTWSAWVFPETFGESNVGVIFQKGSSLQSGQMGFSLASNGALRFSRDYATTDIMLLSSTAAITLNVWQHVCLTWTGSNAATSARMYVNGNEVTYSVLTNGVGAKNSDAAVFLNVGNRGGFDNTFDGQITEVACWGSAILSLDQINLLASSRIKRLPLQLTSSTGSLRLYYPLDNYPDGAAVTGSAMDLSINGNHGIPQGTLVARAEEVLSYA